MTTLKTVFRYAGLGLALFWLASCGPTPVPDKSTYSYDLSEELQVAGGSRVCTTQRIYGIKEQYCAALNNQELNAHCASEQRRQLFNLSGCDGAFDGTVVAGSIQSPGDPAKQARVSYEFIQSGNGTSCSTGLRTFGSRGELCFSILDDAANNNCARDKRQAYFDVNCD